jgi:hypothetical protein
MKKYIYLFLMGLGLMGISHKAQSQGDCNASGLFVNVKTSPTAQYNAYSTRTICQLPAFYENEPLVATNIYGSRTDKRTTATGFYYAKQVDGRWWVVDPEGYLNICRGVNTIAQGSGSTSKTVFYTKFGTTEVWIDSTKKMLNEAGFNCAGAWSSNPAITQNPNQQSKPLAYTIILNWMSGYGAGRTSQQPGHMGYPQDAIFVFEKGFADYCETKAQALAANATDANLFGYFSDNELPFYTKSLNNFLRLGKTSQTDENYLAAKKWLTDNNYKESDTTNTDVQKKFLAFVGKTYYSIVFNAIKRYDPNHLYLGTRVDKTDARDNKYFMQAIGPFVDILSINYYFVWTPSASAMANWGANLNKPFIITEFYTKGMDAGLANNSGAGWIVPTQLDRGYAYQHFALALLESKYCVGWHWFKYFDNDPSISNPEPSNIDGNKGMVNIMYEPYEPLMRKMKELNQRVYNLTDYFDCQPLTTSIYPEADAYFKGSTCLGTDDRLGIKNTTDIAYFREAFIRFDLTGQAANIGDANLKLSVLRTGDAGMAYKAELVESDAWGETSVTYENHPAASTEIGQWAHNSDVVLNVKKVFQETAKLDKKLSIKLSAVNPGVSQIEYASRENATVSLRPRIEITPDGPANLATLADLFIGGKRWSAFHPETMNYTIKLPQGTLSAPDIQFLAQNSETKVELSNPTNLLSAQTADRTATLKVTSADGQSQKTYIIRFDVEGVSTSVNEIINNQTTIYPNPTTIGGKVKILLDGQNNKGGTLLVRDISGRIIQVLKIADGQSFIEFSAPKAAGIYMLSLESKGQVRINKLIVR